MAVIVGGNPFGEFRGKMGGVIFSRNKGGQYVKGYAVPVDPASSAQVNARVTFAQAMSAFHTMDPAGKVGWNVFAASYFNSKNRGNVPGIHSGVNAFVSLRNVLLSMERSITDIADLVIEINAVPATLPGQTTIITSSIPPTTPMTGVLDGGNFSINGLNSVSYNSALTQATFEFGVTFNSSPSAPTPTPSTGSILTDGQGKQVGFALYASNMLPQSGVFVNNPDIILVGNTGIIDAYTTPSVVTTSIGMTITDVNAGLGFGDVINQIQAGGTYRWQLYMFNTEGQILKVGEITSVAS